MMTAQTVGFKGSVTTQKGVTGLFQQDQGKKTMSNASNNMQLAWTSCMTMTKVKVKVNMTEITLTVTCNDMLQGL